MISKFIDYSISSFIKSGLRFRLSHVVPIMNHRSIHSLIINYTLSKQSDLH